MDINLLITFLAVIILIYILGRIFVLPMKMIGKLILNSVIGAGGLYLINLIGGYFGFHIGINIFTILFAAILGIPGTMLLILFKVFF